MTKFLIYIADCFDNFLGIYQKKNVKTEIIESGYKSSVRSRTKF